MGHRCGDVSVQVRPSILGVAMSELPVEFDQNSLRSILQVSAYLLAGGHLADLPLASGQAVCLLDLSQVTTLQHRMCTSRDVIEDLQEH